MRVIAYRLASYNDLVEASDQLHESAYELNYGEC